MLTFHRIDITWGHEPHDPAVPNRYSVTWSDRFFLTVHAPGASGTMWVRPLRLGGQLFLPPGRVDAVEAGGLRYELGGVNGSVAIAIELERGPLLLTLPTVYEPLACAAATLHGEWDGAMPFPQERPTT